jgi:hypothetical protein
MKENTKMQKSFDVSRAPQTPLRADRPDQIRGVEATPGGLIRSTVIAGSCALAMTGIVYMPAEYGIDPTGFGAILGLTEMGQIKQQLYAEDAADAAAPRTVALDPATLARLDNIEGQLAAISAVIGAPAAVTPMPQPQEVAAEPAPVTPTAVETAPAPAIEAALAEATAADWRDEVSYTLPPGEGIEVKLVMQEGEVARFEWSANGGVVNYDTHGDGSGQNISYEQGRAVPEQSGELTAAFTGNHGWFWRNRTDAPVTVTLRTAGDYAELKTP